jgi:hypothetical protein
MTGLKSGGTASDIPGMKVNIPRMFVGTLLIALAWGVVFTGLTGMTGARPTAGGVLLAVAASFVGTQVLLGRRIPGFKRRTRSVH